MQDQQNNTGNKGDKNKIYFLIIVIIALLGINGYLLIRDKEQDKKYITVNTEKDQLKLEVEKIEVELDRVNLLNVSLNDQLKEEQELARQKIAQLKVALQKGTLTQKELEEAKKEILSLNEFVKGYKNQIASLEQENSLLKTQKDSLTTTVNESRVQNENLKKTNQDLNQKVKAGAALKAANTSIIAYKVKNSGKLVEVDKASSTNKLTITFDLAPNDLAEKGFHTVFLRVFDPAGNLIADENNLFEIQGEKLQYSKYTEIEYKDDNPSYKMDWINPRPFIKGTYNILLYTDGYLMGKSRITLR